MKEILKDLDKWTDIPCTWIESLRLIYRFNNISIKFPAWFFFFVDIDKLILKFTWEGKEMRIARISLKKKKKGKLEESYYTVLRLTVKLQYSRP